MLKFNVKLLWCTMLYGCRDQTMLHGWTDQTMLHGWTDQTMLHGWTDQPMLHGWTDRTMIHGWTVHGMKNWVTHITEHRCVTFLRVSTGMTYNNLIHVPCANEHSKNSFNPPVIVYEPDNI